MKRRHFLSMLATSAVTPTFADSPVPLSDHNFPNDRVVTLGYNATRSLLTVHDELRALECGDHLYCCGALSNQSLNWVHRKLATFKPDHVFIAGFLHEPMVASRLPEFLVALADIPDKRTVNVHMVLPSTKGDISTRRNALKCLAQIRKGNNWNMLSYTDVDEHSGPKSGSLTCAEMFRQARATLASDIVRDILFQRSMIPNDK